MAEGGTPTRNLIDEIPKVPVASDDEDEASCQVRPKLDVAVGQSHFNFFYAIGFALRASTLGKDQITGAGEGWLTSTIFACRSAM